MNELELLAALANSPPAKTAADLIGRVCRPMADNLGQMIGEKFNAYRAKNVIDIANKSQKHVDQLQPGMHAHPKIVGQIMAQGSWDDDPFIQELWSGLLASSCTEKGDDDSNLNFLELLHGLTRLQAKVMDFSCQQATKVATPAGLIGARELRVTLTELCHAAEETDIQRLDRELDRLRVIGLLSGGLNLDNNEMVLLTPTPLALHMYVRCHGSRKNPIEFFDAKPGVLPATASVPTVRVDASK